LSGRFYSNIENIDEPFERLIPGVKDYRAQQPWGTWIFDARLSWQISQKVRLTAMAKNVLNEEFMTRPADLQAPRSFQLSLGVKM
jgi:iron complex outermembrane receptor protein